MPVGVAGNDTGGNAIFFITSFSTFFIYLFFKIFIFSINTKILKNNTFNILNCYNPFSKS
jgi:hypothetical protein